MGRRTRVRVEGSSMQPLLLDGQEVLVARVRHVRPGDLIFCRHPYKSKICLIKKVDHIKDDGRLHLLGLNPAQSTDSRSFGEIAPDHVLGKVSSRVS